MHLRAHVRGFTIVELMVVVAILMILLALLLPNLGKAREVARRSVCGSNQKQLHTAQYGSGQLNNNAIYMAHNGAHMQYNYTVNNWEGSQFLGPWGFLLAESLLTDNRWISCPTSPTQWYDLKDNPNPAPQYGRYNQWPPLVEGPVDTPARHTRAAYGQRPETTFSFVAPSPGVDFTGLKLLGKRTQLDNFMRKAIFADNCTDPAATRTRHGDGMNVTYGDGAVLYVPYNVYKQSQLSILPGSHSAANNVFVLNKVGGVAISGIFYDLDQWRENNQTN